MSINKHIVVGNLVSGVSIASNGTRDTLSATVAVNEYTKADGTQVVSFHPIIASGPVGFAKNVVEYLTKGKGVTVVGTPYISEKEKDGHVYRNHGIRLDRLGDMRFNGQDTIVAPTPGNVQEEKPQGQVDAEKRAADLAQDDQQNPNPAPAADFDANDDDIPF